MEIVTVRDIESNRFFTRSSWSSRSGGAGIEVFRAPDQADIQGREVSKGGIKSSSCRETNIFIRFSNPDLVDINPSAEGTAPSVNKAYSHLPDVCQSNAVPSNFDID